MCLWVRKATFPSRRRPSSRGGWLRSAGRQRLWDSAQSRPLPPQVHAGGGRLRDRHPVRGVEAPPLIPCAPSQPPRRPGSRPTGTGLWPWRPGGWSHAGLGWTAQILYTPWTGVYKFFLAVAGRPGFHARRPSADDGACFHPRSSTNPRRNTPIFTMRTDIHPHPPRKPAFKAALRCSAP